MAEVIQFPVKQNVPITLTAEEFGALVKRIGLFAVTKYVGNHFVIAE